MYLSGTLQDPLLTIKDLKEQLNAIGLKNGRIHGSNHSQDINTMFDPFVKTINIISTSVGMKFNDLSNNILLQDRWKKQFGSSNKNDFKMDPASNFKGKSNIAKNEGRNREGNNNMDNSHS